MSSCPEPLVLPCSSIPPMPRYRVHGARRAGGGSRHGLQIQVLNASTSREIDAAFATFVRERPDALFIGGDAFFTNRRVQMADLAARHAIPAIYSVA